MCADAGRRIESERRPSCFVVFSKKQRFYMLFSFLSKCGTLYLVIIFCIIEYKNRCVRIKAHTSAQIPDGMASGSPQLRRTLFLSCPRSCSAAYCSPFSRIYAATVSLDGILLSFFSLSESRTASTSTRSTQNAQDDGCGRMLGCICCMSSRSMAGSPLCLLCSFLRRPCICRGGIFCF